MLLSTDQDSAPKTVAQLWQRCGCWLHEACYVCRVNGNLNLSRAIGDLKYKGNEKLAPAEQIITAQPDIVKV